MKKKIEIEYQTPLEFIATYTREDYKGERDSLEEHCEMPIINIIAKISEDDIYDKDHLYQAFQNFAPEVGYDYCLQHDKFHNYEKCPLCQLEEIGIIIRD